MTHGGGMTQALLLYGHPEPDSFNGRLAAAYAQGYRAGGGALERIDLVTLAFDRQLRAGYRAPQTLEPDLLRVQAAIERADHLVWVFPTWWAAPPSCVRALVERTFLPGWAFRYEPKRALPRGLLAGRSARVVMTMDAPGWWYSLVQQRTIHRSFGTATLRFCGLRPVAFTAVHGVHGMAEASRQRWCERVAAIATHDARSRAKVLAHAPAREGLPVPVSSPRA